MHKSYPQEHSKAPLTSASSNDGVKSLVKPFLDNDNKMWKKYFF